MCFSPVPGDETIIGYEVVLPQGGELYQIDVACSAKISLLHVQFQLKTDHLPLVFIANHTFDTKSAMITLYPEHDQTVGSGYLRKYFRSHSRNYFCCQ